MRTPALPRRAPWYACLLGVSLLGFTACDSDPGTLAVGPAAGRVQRLELTPTSPRELTPPRVVQSIRVGEVLPTNWRLMGQNPELVRGSGPAGPWTGLKIESARAGLISIPGSFAPDEFRELVLSMAVEGMVDVGIKLKRNEQVVLVTPMTRVRGGGQPMAIRVELPGIGLEREPFDAIVVRYVRVQEEPTFLGFDLVWTDRTGALPESSDGPGPVDIRGELRYAVGLSSLAPLVAEFETEPGLSLVLGYGRPASIRGWGEETVLRVRITRGEELLQSHALPMGEDDERWHDEVFSLEELPAGPLQVEYSLEGNSTDEVLCALATPLLTRPLDEPRTVVLVTSDTHRADHLQAGRDSVDVRTPFLDGLAARGLLFEDCFSSTNITIPSHAALLTGTSPRDTGIVDNITALADGAQTLAELYRAAGFSTLALVSARHLRDAQSGLGQGFDRMLAPESDRVVDSSITVDQLLESLTGLEGRSLFLWLHVFDAHGPYEAPDELIRLYYPDGRDPYDESLPRLKGKAQPAWDLEVRDPAWPLSQYKAEVTYLDSQLERALSHARFDTAVIAVTADHGESLGGHGIYFEHHGLFPDTLAVPLILVAPGVRSGGRVASPVRQLDLGRTLLDMSGLGAAVFPGQNLLRWTEPERADSEEPRFALSSHALAASIEQGGWFLSLRISPSVVPRRAAHQVELYYLPDDWDCTNDLVDSEHERAKEMRARLIAWLNAPRVVGMAREGANPAADLAQLAELGYAGGEPSIPADRPWYEPNPRAEWVRRFE